MSDLALKLDAAALNAFLAKAFPEAGPQLPEVVEVEPGRVLVARPSPARPCGRAG